MARLGLTMAFLLLLSTAGCADQSTRVLLIFTVDEFDESDEFDEFNFRPDHIEITWGLVEPGSAKRWARVPAEGSLQATGNALGSVLIILDDARPGERRFIARGKRGVERVSGDVESVPWRPHQETKVSMVLGCYDDPEEADPVPGCRAGASSSNSDGGEAGANDRGRD